MAIKVRAIVGVMIFFGYFVMYIVRYNLSVHILDMTSWIYKKNLSRTKSTASWLENTELPVARRRANQSTAQRSQKISRTRLNLPYNMILWDDLKIAQLFSAYHIGYCICYPIFLNVGDSLGPTWVVSIAGLASGALNCLTPASAYLNFWLLFVVRVLCGFCAVSLFFMGAMYPSMVQVLRHWVPPIERNHFMWAYCGVTTGTFSTFILCAAVQYHSRWPLGFYITGAIQLLWAGLWTLLITDYPSKHPFISKEELTHLNHSIGTIFTIRLTNTQAPPWSLILRSVPFWALCMLNFGYAWLIICMCLHGPMFYTRVLDYTIYAASIITSVPFFLRLIFGTIVIHLFHWYQHNSDIERIQYLRKYSIVVSHVVPGFLLTSMWLSNVLPGPILLTSAIAITAAGMDLTLDLCYDLSPNYFNSINTLIKMIGNIPGIIIPLLIGEITYLLNNSPHVWKHIWCVNGAIILLSGLFFLIWGETRIQPWNTIGERFRPRRPMVPEIRPSLMSNIAEVDDEDDTFSRQASAQVFKKNSIFSRPFGRPSTTVPTGK